MTIRHRIHELIEKRNITKVQLAREAGIDREALENVLYSNIPFKGAVILGKLAKYFHVSVHWLITGESEDTETQRRLKGLLDENNNLRKEVKKLKEFVAKLAPCKYDEYLGN
jgi:transcriptional regulator with XRE-family HTH domain